MRGVGGEKESILILCLYLAIGKLIEEFTKYGQIVTVKIVHEKNSPHTKIGFVRYPHHPSSPPFLLPCSPTASRSLLLLLVLFVGPTFSLIPLRYQNVECASKAIEDKNGTKLSPDLSPLTGTTFNFISYLFLFASFSSVYSLPLPSLSPPSPLPLPSLSPPSPLPLPSLSPPSPSLPSLYMYLFIIF